LNKATNVKRVHKTSPNASALNDSRGSASDLIKESAISLAKDRTVGS
jgi:hypothetical protein